MYKDKNTIVQILSTDTETVVSDYSFDYNKRIEYQTEAQLEEHLSNNLKCKGMSMLILKLMLNFY